MQFFAPVYSLFLENGFSFRCCTLFIMESYPYLFEHSFSEPHFDDYFIIFMSKGNYGYYQKVHKILFMPSSIMFMPKCNSIYYHREHKKRLLPISNYDFTLMLISDLIKIYVKVGSPLKNLLYF